MTAFCTTVPSHLLHLYLLNETKKLRVEFKFLKGFRMNVGPSVTGTCHPGDNPLRLLRILARDADLITSMIPKLSSY